MNLALRHHSIPDSPLAQWDARWKLAAIVIAVVLKLRARAARNGAASKAVQ